MPIQTASTEVERLVNKFRHSSSATVWILNDGREGLARRIAAVDAAIDKEVYALYGLTEAEEIALVQNQLRTKQDQSATT